MAVSRTRGRDVSTLLVAVAVASVVLLAGRAVAWEARIDTLTRPDLFFAKVDVGGDVVGAAYVGDTGGSFVLKLTGSSGTLAWRSVGVPAAAVAFDGARNVVTVGVAPGNPSQAFSIAKLAATTGAVLWRQDLSASGAYGFAVAVDSHGEVLVAGGRTPMPPDGAQVVVAKLDGDTGTEIWRRVLDGSGYALVAAGDDDAVVAGFVGPVAPPSFTRFVAKLSSLDGTDRWRNESDVPVSVNPYGDHPPFDVFLAADPSSADVAVADPNGTSLLSGADGSEKWNVPPSQGGNYSGIVFGEFQDVVVVNSAYFKNVPMPTTPPGTPPVLFVAVSIASLAVTDGTERWRHQVGSSYPAPAGPAVGAGAVVVAWRYVGVGASMLNVVKLAGADGSVAWTRTSAPGVAAPADFAPSSVGVAAGGVVAMAGIDESHGRVALVEGFRGTDGALEVCGDGVLDAGEVCDDGDRDDDDCCSCASVIPDGAPCEDRNDCTADDRCHGGVCMPGPRLRCEPCGRCLPRASGCAPAPAFLCRTPAVPADTTVTLRAGRSRRGWRLFASWDGGSGAVDDFGNPQDTTGYALCLYPAPITSSQVFLAPAAGRCRGATCWRSTEGGFVYRDPALTPDGMARLSIRSEDGRTRIRVKGSGRHLELPTLPVEGETLIVELLRTDSPICWATDVTAFVRNDAHVFRARGR